MKNFLSSNMFKMSFDSERFKDSIFCDYVTSINIPGFQLGIVQQPSTIRLIERPGDSITFNDLSLEFKVDENFETWGIIYKWIHDLRDFNKTMFDNSIVTDATIILLTNKNNTNKGIKFFDLFPYNLSDFQMSLDESESMSITCEATFKYTSMEFLDAV